MKLDRESFNIGSCIGCGHCTFACPASHFERNFSPRGTAENFVLHGMERLDLWSCLTCGACRTVCPEGVEFPSFMRAVREERRATSIPVRSHAGIIDSIRSLDASGKGIGRSNEWVTEDMHLEGSSDVALFVGCLPMLDVVFKDLKVDLVGILRSAVYILNEMGIRPRLLDGERCCGHDAYWLGEMDTFDRLARMNLDAIGRSKVKTIITVCPECSNTLGQIYPERFGDGGYKVMHIAEVAAKGIEDGTLEAERDEAVYTYQDPCRLGRHSGVYDEPREIVSALGKLKEMPRNREMAACCGSTCFAQCDHIVKKWQVARLEEARGTGADALMTACPKCMIHLSCAQKDFGTYKDRPKIPLKDVSVALAENIRRRE
ncbi:MAG: (Fe-S)-binding protein [Euryarchaeota archaeon]|nr:(Fe-S)-binding protein [Euryarchaeota archaeon]